MGSGVRGSGEEWWEWWRGVVVSCGGSGEERGGVG